MCRIAHMLMRRRYYKSPGSEDGGGGGRFGSGGARVGKRPLYEFTAAQLRGTFDHSDKRSRLGDCLAIRQIARSVRWPFCAADSQAGRRNFWPYRDPLAGSIGAPMPGMVIVENPARFTPIREFGRPFPKTKTRRPPQTRQRGELAEHIRLRRNGCLHASGSSF